MSNAIIEQEAKELANAPKITPILGQFERCHLCGRIADLTPFDTHVRGSNRKACALCHPHRRT